MPPAKRVRFIDDAASVAKQPRAKKKDPFTQRLPPAPPPTKETHGILWVPGRGFERANYMGPGTNITTRLRKGIEGKTPVDEVSRLHDIEYTLASSLARNEKEHAQFGRQADERMIRNGWKAYKEGKESLFNTVEGVGLIKAKTLLEDWGILSKTKFLSERTFAYKAGLGTREANEYELLLRARSEALSGDGPSGDPAWRARAEGS